MPGEDVDPDHRHQQQDEPAAALGDALDGQDGRRQDEEDGGKVQKERGGEDEGREGVEIAGDEGGQAIQAPGAAQGVGGERGQQQAEGGLGVVGEGHREYAQEQPGERIEPAVFGIGDRKTAEVGVGPDR